jgi:hypothetical protein
VWSDVDFLRGAHRYGRQRLFRGGLCGLCGLAGLGECAKRQARDDHHAGDEDCGAQARRDGLPMDGAGGRELAG